MCDLLVSHRFLDELANLGILGHMERELALPVLKHHVGVLDHHHRYYQYQEETKNIFYEKRHSHHTTLTDSTE